MPSYFNRLTIHGSRFNIKFQCFVQCTFDYLSLTRSKNFFLPCKFIAPPLPHITSGRYWSRTPIVDYRNEAASGPLYHFLKSSCFPESDIHYAVLLLKTAIELIFLPKFQNFKVCTSRITPFMEIPSNDSLPCPIPKCLEHRSDVQCRQWMSVFRNIKCTFSARSKHCSKGYIFILSKCWGPIQSVAEDSYQFLRNHECVLEN